MSFARHDGIHLTRQHLDAWAGFTLSDAQLERLAQAIEHSSIPDAIATIATGLAPDDSPAAVREMRFDAAGDGVTVSACRGEDAVVVQVDTAVGAGVRVRINLNDTAVWDGNPQTDHRPGAHLAAELANSRGSVDYTYLDDRETVGGSWLFDVAPGFTFEASWENAVRDFRRDPSARRAAKSGGYGLNYGDLIDLGGDVLARYGLTLVAAPQSSRRRASVDHDDILIDPRNLCSTPECPNGEHDDDAPEGRYGGDGSFLKCGTCADQDIAGTVPR